MNLSKRCVNCGEQCISHIEFLEGLDEEKQNRVMEGAVRRTCRKGSSLFRQGDPVDAVYIIHTGRVKLCTWDPDGREQIVGLFSDKDTIWEGIFIEGSRYPYSAVCMTDVYCCRVMRKDLEKVMEDPAIAMRVIGLLSRKLHEANERVMLLSSSSPRARIAGFMLNRSRSAGSSSIVLKLDDIAASVSLRPETVSRRMRELEREGLIQKTGQSSFRILDAEGLEAAADKIISQN